jgi:hypothetical protein
MWPAHGTTPHQALRGWNGALGGERRFDGVDVVVIGAGMFGPAAQHVLEHALGFGHASGGGAVDRIPAPARGDQQAFGVERLRVEIVGVIRGEFLHGGDVCFGFVFGAPRGGGFQICALLGQRTGGLASGFYTRAGSLHIGRGIEVHVNVRSLRHRHPPIRHGGRRIELGSFSERAQRLVTVEAVEEREALVEIFLRVGVGCGDRMPPCAQTLI